jgi:hypothetical protein
MAVTATGAAAVIALGAALRPALPGRASPQHNNVTRTTTVAPTLVAAATHAAVTALACPPPTTTRANCGQLTVTDANGYAVNASVATVLIVGTLHEQVTTTPVALRVEMHRHGSAWSTAVSVP